MTQSPHPAPDDTAAAPKGGAAADAQILIDAKDSAGIAARCKEMLEGSKSGSAKAARIVDAIADAHPNLLASQVPTLIAGLTTGPKRVVQASANALAALARVAPARVARHLEKLTKAFSGASPEARDGLVRIFAGLCAASVAYQRRLSDVLALALGSANSKELPSWSELVLPALKGEPHARARGVVEERLPKMPKKVAAAIAEQLGVKLRRTRR